MRGELTEVQELADAFFPLPLEFRPEDQQDMEYTRMLLRGEQVQEGYDDTVQADTASKLLTQVDTQGELFAFAASNRNPYSSWRHLALGFVQRWMPTVQMSNLDDVRTWDQARARGTIEVRLIPSDDKRMTIRQILRYNASTDTARDSRPAGSPANRLPRWKFQVVYRPLMIDTATIARMNNLCPYLMLPSTPSIAHTRRLASSRFRMPLRLVIDLRRGLCARSHRIGARMSMG